MNPEENTMDTTERNTKNRNGTRRAYEYLRAHPGRTFTCTEVDAALGFTPNHSGSVLSYLVKTRPYSLDIVRVGPCTYGYFPDGVPEPAQPEAPTATGQPCENPPCPDLMMVQYLATTADGSVLLMDTDTRTVYKATVLA